ncbi:MAG: shikimate dehydrogenase [Anaerolineaceae bacterium]|nr:shikimate dehydrogenase [Anaerolineaceae bacterium]
MDKKTFHFGLTGYPLAHSLSPALHDAALAATGLEGSYDLFPISPLPDGFDDLAALVNRVHTGQLDGLNVTIPHKQSVLQFVEECSPAVKRVGAANVIYRLNGHLVAENTDIPAFKEDLNTWLSDFTSEFLPPRRALVLGAGGAARSVVDALLSDTWKVVIAARNLQQAVDLCASLSPYYPTGGLDTTTLTAPALKKLEPPFLIVNTTPAGMWPDTDLSPWPDGLALPETSFVYDLVYNPAETALVKAARAVPIPALSGGGMLIGQAALAFTLWTGRPAPKQVMRRVFDQKAGLAEKPSSKRGSLL